MPATPHPEIAGLPSLATYTHFKTAPGPSPAEDEKNLDARMAALVAAGAEPHLAEPISPRGRG